MKFELDAATGQMRAMEALDYEEQDTCTVPVSVHDRFNEAYEPSESIDDTISIVITAAAAAPEPQNLNRQRSTALPDTRILRRRHDKPAGGPERRVRRRWRQAGGGQ